MFEGFSPQTVDFLWGIRMNNNREWFTDHKKDYVNYLYEPMKALGKDLFRPFLEKPGSILKVSRIYRDARMHYPVPYKERLWLCIRQEGEDWLREPCLFFEMAPEGASYGFGFWEPGAGLMERFRKQWAANPAPFLKLMEDTRRASGVAVTAGKCYKRPKPAPIPELAPYFAWRGDIQCIRQEPVSESLFGPALGERTAEFFRQLMPLYEYFTVQSADG